MSAAVTDARATAQTRARLLRGLYAVTPDLADTTLLQARVAAALRGGAAAIQYRNKPASPELRRVQARSLASLVQAHGRLFIVNDDPELAREVGADGVHVGEGDADLTRARSLVGAQSIIGVSCYNDAAHAKRAVSAGADYIAFGSFFPSSTKPGARRAELELLHDARRFGVPVVAIGGITAANASTLIDAGADALAVISDVFDRAETADIERAARALVGKFRSTP